MSNIRYLYTHEGWDLGAPEGDTPADLIDWVKEQLSTPTYAGGGRFAISDQMHARLTAVAAIKDAVDHGRLPNIFLDRALETQPEPPETFERIYGGIWNIPQEE